jgi:hypothetical protein
MMSPVREQFHQAVLTKDFNRAAILANGLSMPEMLQALAAIGQDNRDKLASALLLAINVISVNGAARIAYAKQTVDDMAAPAGAPSDLLATGQVQMAQDFVKEPSVSGKIFTSEDAAARDVLAATNPASINQNREYWGWILRKGTTFNATRPTRSPDETGANPVDPVVAPGGVVVALYHTHGSGFAFVNGRLASESFSLEDRIVLKHKKVDGYLGTPSGTFLRLTATPAELATPGPVLGGHAVSL